MSPVPCTVKSDSEREERQAHMRSVVGLEIFNLARYVTQVHACINVSNEVLAWLSVWSEVQMICIWFS